jgi:hypothetical protein
MTLPFGIGPLLWIAVAAAAGESEDKVQYLRLLPGKTVTECVFTEQRGAAGRHIQSVTGRGAAKMTVTARYDAQDALTGAEATLSQGDQAAVARVEVADGKAKVKREGQETLEFAVPKGVIVTSAPDWTDTFLLCRHYDRRKGGPQEFAGLWIHPTMPAQRLTFTVERVGTDTIEHGGKKVELDRLAIRIRNNSAYVAWANAAGQMIKLTALPLKENGGTTLVQEEYEKSAAALRPPP